MLVLYVVVLEGLETVPQIKNTSYYETNADDDENGEPDGEEKSITGTADDGDQNDDEGKRKQSQSSEGDACLLKVGGLHRPPADSIL
jgi:hypothetical protein